MQKTILRLTTVALFLILAPPPRASAVSREIVELQTQVQQLQDMLQHLQTSNDERMGVIINLVQQNTDSVNKMASVVNNLETEVKTVSDASASGNTQLSTQIQALNDSVDELKTRLANLTTQVQNIQSQLQNVNSPPPTQPASVPAQPGAAVPAPQGAQGTAAPAAGPPQPDDASLAPQGAPQAPPQAAPPVDQLYQSALRDYNAARYPLASSEFGDVIRYYPQDPLAGNAEFYLGEVAYRQKKYDEAVKHYDRVLEQYSGNSKAPAAELRKGESLLVLGQKDAGVRELRTLVQRYPQTPEAQAGRSRLNGMGVRIYPAKPSPYQQ